MQRLCGFYLSFYEAMLIANWSHNRCCYYFIDNVKNTSVHHNNAYIYKLSDCVTVMLSK